VRPEMPLMITYYNLKDGVSEQEFVKKTKELFDSAKTAGLGSPKFYRHHWIGANKRLYQMHIEFKDLGAWDRFGFELRNIISEIEGIALSNS